MGYGWHDRMTRVVFDTTWLAAIACQTTADKAFARVLGAITCLRISALITTAMTVTAAVLDIDQRITPGSDTGRVTDGVGQLTLPVTGSTIGQIVYKDVRKDINPGDEIVLKLTTASTAGGAVFGVEYENRDFVPTDFTEMVASA